MRNLILLLTLLLPLSSYSQFNDSGWDLVYQENFDGSYTATDRQEFGQNNWLVYQLHNGGAITIEDGYAQLNAPDFWNAALIRSTLILPPEYKIRTKIGYINYDLTNYEQEDFNNPDFNTHNGYYENGMYFLTVTDDTCTGNECAENWWHYHRKMVIDIDNHLDYGGGETFHPIYMVYMAPEVNSGGNLLRTWTGAYWDNTAWNWNPASFYNYDAWYYAELEKRNQQIILRLYDENQNIIEETTPVNISLVNAMDNPVEFLYVGEPHTDDYEGDARIDEISLLLPNDLMCCLTPGDANHDGNINISDLTYFVEYMFHSGPSTICFEEFDNNGDCGELNNISDLTYFVDWMFQGGPPPVDCHICP